MNKLEFSADGKRLLGAFRIDGKDHGLAWFDLATGDRARRWPRSTSTSASPSRRTASGSSTPRCPDQPGEQSGNDGSHTDLWKLPADGRGSPRRCAGFPARVHDLCWADGGRSLVVAAELGQAHDDLWKLPLDDPLRGMVKLTSGQADEDRPSVSRDGKWLVYTDNRAGPTALVVRDTGERRGGRRPVRHDGLPPADRHAAAHGRGRGEQEARRSRGSRCRKTRAGSTPRPAACTARCAAAGTSTATGPPS